MEKEIREISFNIYASNDMEAERGRQAFVQFIKIMGMNGAKVTGDKLFEAFKLLNTNSFITSQIIKFFKRESEIGGK